MAMDMLAVAPLYQGSDINKIRLMTQPSKKTASLLKSLVPSKNRLTTIETKRIMSVLDETIHKVELVTLLSQTASRVEHPEGMWGEDLTQAVREHEDLCWVLLDKVSSLQDRERWLQEEEELEEEAWVRDRRLSIELRKSRLLPLAQQIGATTRNILRLLLSNPQAAGHLQTWSPGRSAGAQSFIESLMELRGFLFEKLLTSPMEARDKAQLVQDITKHSRRNQEVIDALGNELAASLKKRGAEVPPRGTGQVGGARSSPRFWQLGFSSVVDIEVFTRSPNAVLRAR